MAVVPTAPPGTETFSRLVPQSCAEPKAPAPRGFGVGPGGDNTYVVLCAKCLEVSKGWDLCRTISRVNKSLRHSLIGVLGTSQQL